MRVPGVRPGGRVTFCLRQKVTEKRLNAGSHDRTHCAPEALRSGNYRESDQKLGRALLHSAMQQRRRKHRDGMILVFAREFNSSCGWHLGISRSREMQHEQREVP